MKALTLFVAVVAMFLTIEGCGGGGGGSSTEGSSSSLPKVASTGGVSGGSSVQNTQNETGQENAPLAPAGSSNDGGSTVGLSRSGATVSATVPEPAGLLLLGLGLMGLAGIRRKLKK